MYLYQVRKILALFLLVLSLCSWVGWSVIYQITLHRHKITLDLTEHSPEQIIELRIPYDQSSTLHWEEAGREFMYQGMMYDVLKLDTSSSGDLLCTCYADVRETQLKQNYLAGIHQHNAGDESDQWPALILKLWSLQAILDPSSLIIAAENGTMDSPVYVCNWTNFTDSPGSPPPKLVGELFGV